MQRKNCPTWKKIRNGFTFWKNWSLKPYHFLLNSVEENFQFLKKKKNPKSHIKSVAPPCGSNISLQMKILCFLARNLSAVLKDCRLKTKARHRSKLIAPKCSTTAEEKRKEMKEENK